MKLIQQALLEQEQAIAAAEKAKALNTSNPTTSSSNPGSVGTILSPPPQLLVEGAEPLHNEQAINQPLTASGIAPNNIPIFQELLFNFLDTQAPELGIFISFLTLACGIGMGLLQKSLMGNGT